MNEKPLFTGVIWATQTDVIMTSVNGIQRVHVRSCVHWCVHVAALFRHGSVTVIPWRDGTFGCVADNYDMGGIMGGVNYANYGQRTKSKCYL